MEEHENKSSVCRMLFGILVNWFVLALLAGIPALILEFSDSYGGVIIVSIIDLVLYLYLYGILGAWLDELSYSISSVTSKIGSVFGIIGMFLRPFPILAYGNNKKYILVLTTTLPMIALGIVFI